MIGFACIAVLLECTAGWCNWWEQRCWMTVSRNAFSCCWLWYESFENMISSTLNLMSKKSILLSFWSLMRSVTWTHATNGGPFYFLRNVSSTHLSTGDSFGKLGSSEHNVALASFLRTCSLNVPYFKFLIFNSQSPSHCVQHILIVIFNMPSFHMAYPFLDGKFSISSNGWQQRRQISKR